MRELLAPPQPGIYRGVSLARYLSWDAWSSSDLKAMRAGPPAMVPWRKANPDSSDAMKIGSAAHCAILEPEKFLGTYAHKPDGMSFSTKEGKAWKAEVADGMVILTHDEWSQVDLIADAFLSKPICDEALKRACEIETSFVWQDDATGLVLKARPDFLCTDGYIYDLKISRHAAARSIQFRTWAEGWVHQLAHYRAGAQAHGLTIKGCRLIIIGPSEPQRHRVYTVQAKQDFLDACALENAAALETIAQCVRDDCWPGTPDSWEFVDLPAVALREELGPIWPDEDGRDLHPLT